MGKYIGITGRNLITGAIENLVTLEIRIGGEEATAKVAAALFCSLGECCKTHDTFLIEG